MRVDEIAAAVEYVITKKDSLRNSLYPDGMCVVVYQYVYLCGAPPTQVLFAPASPQSTAACQRTSTRRTGTLWPSTLYVYTGIHWHALSALCYTAISF